MSIWLGKDPLILASQSRARQMLLKNAGIAFEAVPAGIDERAVQKDSGLTAPGEIAKLLQLAEGEACLLVERNTWQGDQPVTQVRLIYPGNRHRLVGSFSPGR